jgi:hypothetical protein
MSRVGCVCCPLALPNVYEPSKKHWPKIVKAWEKSIKFWFNKFGNECCDISGIKTAEQYWEWWLTGQSGNITDPNQTNLPLIMEDL